MTENGWPPDTNVVVAISLSDCEQVTVPGTNGQLKLWFQKGIPAIMLPAIMADLSEYVESMNNVRGYTDEGSWTNGNSVRSSNHNGATAFDYNWLDHPMGIALDGWHGSDIINGEEEPEIRRILSFYTYKGIQMVWWGNDWNTPKDSMHFQMGYQTYENQLLCWEFINKFIRADGYSTYRRGGQARGSEVIVPPSQEVLAPTLIADAMGNVSGVDYAALAPYVQDCLRKSECTNNNRIAMWFAQIGHESVGLKYMKEIWGPTAAQLTYQGRMGNTNPGDGERYQGRGPIQVTGKDNYRALSQWAHEQGYVDSPTYFVDNPTALERYEYAFLGAAWYWTVARADINELSDQGDVHTVTQRINGGYNGEADRTNRWNHCRTMDLMPLISGEDDWMTGVNVERLNLAIDKILCGGTMPDNWISRGMFNDADEPVEGVDDTVGMLLNSDGNIWNVEMIIGALLGVERDVKCINDTAEGRFPEGSFIAEPDRQWLRDRAIEFAKLLQPLCGKLNATLFTPAKKPAAKKAVK